MVSFARFFDNHGLLTLHRQPQWYYVAGGSHTYVQAFLKQFSGRVHTDATIAAIQRDDQGVTIQEANGQAHRFDQVVIAAHADEALGMLADPTAEERRLLGTWRYSTNETVLHTDLRWMPTNRRAWASWNVFRSAGADERAGVTLTYHMNRLQQLQTQRQYLVTLNPFAPIAEDRIIARMSYTHPTYTAESLATQRELPRLNGVRRTCYCGAYFGHGFHEDAARAGDPGGPPPWEPTMFSKIYPALVVHERYHPVRHRLLYKIYVYAFDLSELADLDRRLPLFGHNRPRPVSLYDADHLDPTPGTIRGKLLKRLATHGAPVDAIERIVMVTSPRFLGHVFNPASFYFCLAASGRLLAVMAEGQQHLRGKAPVSALGTDPRGAFFSGPLPSGQGVPRLAVQHRGRRVSFPFRATLGRR